jgi:hypothetical protein
MDSLNYSMALGISDGSWYWLDTTTGQEFLKLTPYEFSPIVKDNSVWARVTAQPRAVE